jgi:LysR family transcriptional activator of nhaA
VALTDAGQAAFAGPTVFHLGQRITDEVREAASTGTVRLSVGLSDGISKLAAHAPAGAGACHPAAAPGVP